MFLYENDTGLNHLIRLRWGVQRDHVFSRAFWTALRIELSHNCYYWSTHLHDHSENPLALRKMMLRKHLQKWKILPIKWEASLSFTNSLFYKWLDNQYKNLVFPPTPLSLSWKYLKYLKRLRKKKKENNPQLTIQILQLALFWICSIA